ncbi:MAG: DnaB-like helicase C-terminal domain-containing protein [Dehalococcoidia bacterium]
MRTGLEELDSILCDLTAGHLAWLAGPYRAGKSSLLLTVARDVALRQGLKTLVVSGDDSIRTITDWLLAAESGVPRDRVSQAVLSELEERRVVAAAARLEKAALQLEDARRLPREWLTLRLQYLAEGFEPDVILIDGLEGIIPQDSRDITALDLKQLARRLELVVMVATESTLDAIEHADVVLRLDRETLHVDLDRWLLQHPDLPESAFPQNVLDLEVIKNRMGPRGSLSLRIRERVGRVEEWVMRSNG